MPKIYTAYVMKSKTFDIIHIGTTSDVQKRLDTHNNGFYQYTKNRGPWVLAYKETFSSRAEAIAREYFFKTGPGKIFLDTKIK
jgi:putative endonuclease